MPCCPQPTSQLLEQKNDQVPPVGSRILDPLVEECYIEVEKEEIQERIVSVPEIRYIEKVVEVPQVEIIENVIHVDKPVYEEKVVHVPKVIYEDKIVHVAEIQWEEKIEYVPQYVTREKVIHVPDPVVVEIVEPRIKIVDYSNHYDVDCYSASKYGIGKGLMRTPPTVYEPDAKHTFMPPTETYEQLTQSVCNESYQYNPPTESIQRDDNDNYFTSPCQQNVSIPIRFSIIPRTH